MASANSQLIALPADGNRFGRRRNIVSKNSGQAASSSSKPSSTISGEVQNWPCQPQVMHSRTSMALTAPHSGQRISVRATSRLFARYRTLAKSLPVVIVLPFPLLEREIDPLRLHPSEAVWSKDFVGPECLYRDHLGRRVVADFEGAGRVAVQVAKGSLSGLFDDADVSEFPSNFRGYATVVADSDFEGTVRVMKGRERPITGPTSRAQRSVQGAGWVVSAEGLAVDDRFEPSPRPSRDFPVPFFRCASAFGEIEYIPAATKCSLLDSFDLSDQDARAARSHRVQNESKPVELDSTFADGSPRRALILSHLNRATFRVSIPECDGLIIRKTYDRFHGRQRARVLIDVRLAGYWYEPEQDRIHRWAVSDFGIDRRLIEGKSEIEICIDPPPGTPLWSVSRMEIFSLF
jgi:hypothetical protein